jgi:hypothetical protein
MKKNIGNADRIIRVIVAAVIATLYFMNIVTGPVGIVLLVFSLLLLTTSLIGYCPLYTVFGLNTGSVKRQAK